MQAYEVRKNLRVVEFKNKVCVYIVLFELSYRVKKCLE